jgi:hypothetical protein
MVEDEVGNDQVWFILRRVEAAFQRLWASKPREADRPELWGAYFQQRQELPLLINELKLTLERALGSHGDKEGPAERCLAALLIQYDERELSYLGSAQPAQGLPLFQTMFCGYYDGGERYYRYLEDALRAQDTNPLVLEVFLFCLRSGFCGQFLLPEHPARLAFSRELCQRVLGKVTPNTSEPKAPVRCIRGQRFPFQYYLVAATVVLGLWLGLRSLAADHEYSRIGISTCDEH